MAVVGKGAVRSDRSMEPVPAEGLGGLTRRPGRSARIVTALGVVLAVLMGSLTTTTSPVAATGGPSYSILATVAVGADPYGVAVSPDGSRVYVTVAPYYEEDPIPGTVRVINTSNNTVVATVTVGFGPSGVAVSPDGSRVYVVNSAGSVSVIDTSNNTVVATVPVGSGATDVAVSPNGSRAYVTNYYGRSVSVIDTSNNTVVATVTVGAGPVGVAVSPDGSRVYVPNFGGSGSVSVIDTSNNTVVATVTSQGGASRVAVSPDGSRVYVTNSAAEVLSVIDTSNNTVVSTLTGLPSYGVAVSPDGSRVYVATGGGSVSVIDTSNNTVIATVNGLIGPNDVAVSPDGSRVYVTDYSDGSVRVIGASVPVTAPAAPTSLNATPGNGSASIAFTPGADGGAAISKYQYQLGSGSWTDAVGTSSPITITGLTNYATVNIRLRAVNSAGAGAASTGVSVWPRIAGSSLTSVKAQGTTGIRASFAALTPVGGTTSHYWVYAYAKGTNTVAGSCRSTAAARSCVVTGLSANTEYDVAVRGFFSLTGSPTVLPTTDSVRQTVRTRS